MTGSRVHLWRLPGPSRFIARAVDTLLASPQGMLGLALPRPVPDGVFEALEARFTGETSLTPIRVDASIGLCGRSPAHVMAACAEVAPSGIRRVAEFLDAPSLSDIAFIVEDVRPEDWMQWSLFARQLRAERTRAARPAAPVIMMILPNGLPPAELKAAIGGHEFRWLGVVGRRDTEELAERMMQWPGDDLASRTAVSTVVEMAGWDPELVAALAAAPIEVQLDPVPVLRTMAGAFRHAPRSWASGAVDLWDGAPHVSTLCLVADEDEHALKLRLWRARVREVYPFISRVQAALGVRHRPLIERHLPLTKTFFDRPKTYEKPEELELYDLKQILRPALSGRENGLLDDCYRLRTAMAHLDPGETWRIQRASDAWEVLGPELAMDCPGWDWPRCGQTLVVMVGPSGAGKSTYARGNYDHADIISSDEIRVRLANGDDVAVPQAEVFAQLRHEVVARLSAGQVAVVDATNLKKEDRLANARLAPRDIPVEYVLVDRPAHEKAMTAGDRRPEVMKLHAEILAGELEDIRAGDGLPNVSVTLRVA